MRATLELYGQQSSLSGMTKATAVWNPPFPEERDSFSAVPKPIFAIKCLFGGWVFIENEMENV